MEKHRRWKYERFLEIDKSPQTIKSLLMNQMFNVLLFILSKQIDFRSIVMRLQLLFGISFIAHQPDR